MKIKLAEALLRRKELQEKLDRLRQLREEDWFRTRTARKAAHEGFDDVIAQVPLLTEPQIEHAYDWHAKQLRIVDGIIQQANWTCEVDVPDAAVGDYAEPVYLREGTDRQTP